MSNKAILNFYALKIRENFKHSINKKGFKPYRPELKHKVFKLAIGVEPITFGLQDRYSAD